MADSAPKLRKLILRNFKGFREAELNLSDFTVIVGTNASGKSNVRDAFRFLHGIARGYTLPEVFGGKSIGGALQWDGIRGGVREARFAGASSFSIVADFDGADGRSSRYSIDVGVAPETFEPVVLQESVPHAGSSRWAGLDGAFFFSRSILQSIRFLELSPQAMREPSTPGQTALGDRGENLSSVLLAISSDAARKETLLEWVRQLTPMDVVDLDFVFDAAGRVLVTFVEHENRVTSALSVSDGTLRFLALVAAFLTPDPARLYFIEEIESGLHPSRLHLLADLIESQTSKGVTQVVATTHSPQLLGFLSDASLNAATLAYRLPDTPDQRLVRIMDLPDAARVFREHDVASLHATGWLENAVLFAEPAADSKAV